jgi:hypothetical protein
MIEHEAVRPEFGTDETEAAIQALAQTRDIHRALIALLRVGEIRARYEGPNDPRERGQVKHYRFYPHTPGDQHGVALTPEDLRRYVVYDPQMMDTSLHALADAVEELHHAHVDIRLPEHESDVADWAAITEQVHAMDAAYNEVVDLLQHEIVPNLEALSHLAHTRRDELTMLAAALEGTSPVSPSEP